MEQASTTALPALGSEFQGGKYAGITTDKQGAVYALISLDGTKRLNWHDAMAWAEAEGALLPNRVESLMLLANLPNEFKKTWHWTSEQSGADYAWIQYFTDGDQDPLHESNEFQVRLVRRFPLSPSIL